MQRIRVRLSRGPAARLLSQREQIDALRRAFQRLSWPVAFGAGRKPHMRLSFGPAISVGHESEAEYCDLQMVQRMDLAKAKGELEACLPAGYGCHWIKHVPLFFPSLEELLSVALYRIIGIDASVAIPRLSARLQEPHFQVPRKTDVVDQVIDARDLIRTMEPDPGGMLMTLRFGPRKTLKPERILQTACQLDEKDVQDLRVCRAALYIERSDGTLVEP